MHACLYLVCHHAGVYDLALGCVNMIAHRELCKCAVSLFSHHMCVQPWVQLYRQRGSAAHCCSTCPQFRAPNTQVSAVHSLLALVRSSGTRLCMICAIALCTAVKVGITCKAYKRVCIWYFDMHVCMGVYDLVLGCVNMIAHRELRTCAVSIFSHTHVRTALITTP
jgi:hypothetical protein